MENNIDIGKLAALFQKWPGPCLMAFGAILAGAATGIRLDGVAFSGREFAGFEFAAVFLGGIILLGIGTAVLLVRDRLLVEDAIRVRQQKHEQALEAMRVIHSAAGTTVAQLKQVYDDALTTHES